MSSYHCSSYLIFLNNTKNQFTSTSQIFNNWLLNNWLFKIDFGSKNDNNLAKSSKFPKRQNTWFPIKR
ncbi:hypothetical protein CE11_00208 [Megavirus courdo11]|uniref:Uncharacterized protein n=1 Tax=Megavirus courdo11 TaxID=1128140 RepID=K7YVC8_9VIRU|nr:hypothetical protein CE11_00208 [Megavirus courdo11]